MTFIHLILFTLIILPNETPSEPENVKSSESGMSKKPVQLDDIVVSATRTDKRVFDVPNTVNLITEKELRRHRVVRTVPEALKEIPSVMVQKTSHGQGSPYIRGFTSFRTVFLIDGVRLNNSVFRDGPNQYWNTVDPLSISRLEVVKGPGSVLYGSDAIGGVVNAITTNQDQGDQDKAYSFNRTVFYRFASAERGSTGRFEVGGAFYDKLSFLVGGDIKHFGNIRAGRGTGYQPKTGYDEYDGDFKFNYFIDNRSTLTLAYQKVDQDDAWRTHKTKYGVSWEGTTFGSDHRRSFDQSRDLACLRYKLKNDGRFLEDFNATFSYQNQKEDRYRIKSSYKSDKQGFDVGSIGLSFQMNSSLLKSGKWTAGVEYYRDSVDSYKKSWNSDGSFAGSSIQGPVADNSSYDLLGIYMQDDIPIFDRLNLILGARYTFAAVNADKYEDPVTNNEASLTDKWGALVGSMRLLYGLDDASCWNLFTGVSQGFRAPNLSDLTRLDSSGSTWKEVPSPNLDPERYLSYELGIKSDFDAWTGQTTYFYTDIRDMILRTATGQVLPGGELEVTKTNAGDGYIHGVELNGSYRFHSRFTAMTAFSWVYGATDNYPSVDAPKKKEPLSRLMPITTHLGLRWEDENDKLWIEGLCSIATKANKLSSRDDSDTQRIPAGGTPGYIVFTLRSGFKVSEDLTFTTAFENITNEDYRIHGSGLNEPGANLVVGVDWSF